MNSPTISIIIPVFNVEKYVKETLISVKKQSSRPDEVIIINDGSTDSTANILSGFNNSKLIVSSPYSDSSYSGYMLNAGSVYIYNIGNYFDFSIKILAFDAYLNDYFGSSISIYDQWIAVSSQRNDHGSNSGAIYLYQIEDNQILQELKVDSDNLEAYDIISKIPEKNDKVMFLFN